MTEDLPSRINILLDYVSQTERQKKDEKNSKKDKKELEEQIIQLMIDNNINVVRILSHDIGPCDVILKLTEKKRTLTMKCIEESMMKFESEKLNKDILSLELDQKINEALTKHFRPEFLNRIDEVIRFSPLKPESLEQIVRLQLDELKTLLKHQDLDLYVDENTIQTLAEEGYEPEYGARPLRRVIRRRLENPLATQILEEAFEDAKSIRVEIKDDDSKKLLFLTDN